MLDKGLQRNQENLVFEKKTLYPVQLGQNRDLRHEENRILQETQQQIGQPNMNNSKPQRPSQEYSSSSSVSSQLEKMNLGQTQQKTNERDFRQI